MNFGIYKLYLCVFETGSTLATCYVIGEVEDFCGNLGLSISIYSAGTLYMFLYMLSCLFLLGVFNCLLSMRC